jgi:hypothetical protein
MPGEGDGYFGGEYEEFEFGEEGVSLWGGVLEVCVSFLSVSWSGCDTDLPGFQVIFNAEWEKRRRKIYM